MSQPTTAAPRSSRVPPEDAILVRYSPHHELPLSTATSVALHALVIGLLVIAGIVATKLNWGSDNRQLPVGIVTMDEPGGGNGATAGGDGDTHVTPPSQSDFRPRKDDSQPNREPLKRAPIEPTPLSPSNATPDERLLEEARETVDAWRKVSPEVLSKLKKSLGPKGSSGDSGSGHGTGPGSGDETGPGGKIDRSNRPQRWTLRFNTRDGRDYLRQLEAFGAILAVPDPKQPADYLVIRDLHRLPAEAKPEEIGRIESIFWIDDKPDSVRSLARALGLKEPPHFIVFFPTEFEAKLLRLELDYRGKKENEIKETRFDVRLVGGRYEPIVLSQRGEPK
jgi:hypothetical protein